VLKELLDSLEQELEEVEREHVAKTKQVLQYIAREQKSLSVDAVEEVRAIEAMRELQKEKKRRKKEGRRIIPPPP
jgi:ribosome maturation factor RimP